MKTNPQKWLKVVEFAVVGLATWFVAYGGNFDVAPAVPNPVHCPVASSQRAETGEQQRQLLLFLLKLSFQVLLAWVRSRSHPGIPGGAGVLV